MAHGIRQGIAASFAERWYVLMLLPQMKGYDEATAVTHCFATNALLPIFFEPWKPKAPVLDYS
jgi:hypothetical protein